MSSNLVVHIGVVLVIIGALVWLVMQAPFIDATWKQFIRYAAIVGTVIWLLLLLLHQTGVRV